MIGKFVASRFTISLKVFYSKRSTSERINKMQTGDRITLSNGQRATVVTADTDKFKNIIIVELEDHDVRVVDRETLTLAPAKYHDNFGSHSKIW